MVSVPFPVRRTSISRYLVGWLLALSVTVSLVVIVTQMALDYQRRVSQLYRDIDAQVQAIDTALADAIWSVDDPGTRLLLDGLMRIPAVSRIELQTLDDERAVINRLSERTLTTRRYSLVHPAARDRQVGTLTVTLNDADIRARTAARLRAVAFATGLVVLAGGLFVFLLYRRLLVRHLEHIARYARRLGPDNLGTRLVLDRPAHRGRDELDLVVDAFERMRKRMAHELAVRAENEAELELHRSRLEELVIERTRELERARAQAERLSNTDHLTGLSNRRHFYATAQAVLSTALESDAGQAAIGLMMVDIDHFKRINDQYGHASGDRVIAEVGKRLRADMPAEALVGRLGGEEFAVLLPQTDLAGLQSRAEALRAGLAATPIPVGVLGPLACTVSIGIAMGGDGIVGIDDLLAHADDALYRAKHAGRNRVETGLPGMRSPTHASPVRRRGETPD